MMSLVARCDRERVIQVLSNMVGNAIKFTPRWVPSSRGAAAPGHRRCLSSATAAPGSPRRPTAHLRTLLEGRGPARKGRGLGLYIAKGLVEAQGGAIWVDSPAGRRRTFSFTLPLASAAEVDSFRATMETKRGSLGRDPVVERK